MAITHGHGNPDWTRDEVILALDFYFNLGGKIPPKTDTRVRGLSDLLRSFPYHAAAARKVSFRNPDGVVFKLQNIRQVATGKGLSNVSQVDRAVWRDFGDNPVRVNELATAIRTGINVLETIPEETDDEEVFPEGRILTKLHKERERHRGLRKKLLAIRIRHGKLRCEICACGPRQLTVPLNEAIFEAHHVLPLSRGEVRNTRLKDLALICANCHRLLHRAIIFHKRWLSIEEAQSIFSKW